MEDIVIIGAGVIGCSIARELSRYDIKIAVLEREEDVACGTSKANSGIVHAGFDADPGTLKARLNTKGNKLFPTLCEELDVPFKINGSLVVAVEDEEEKVLYELLERGKINGIKNLEILSRSKLFSLEPNLNPKARAALYAPTGGIVCPYELTIALAESACINGVKFMLNTPVTDIQILDDGTKLIETPKNKIQAKYVINAAGLFADEISRMIGAKEYSIKARKGEYILFDKQFGQVVKMTIFPTPSKLSKGILVSPTVDGNIFIGPNSNYVEDKFDTSVQTPGIEEIIRGGEKLVPNLPLKNIITSFAGLRAVTANNDFIIEASESVKGFINVCGIQSPGLTSAPAIALMVKNILEENIKLKPKQNFIPNRPKKYRFRELDNEKRKELIEQDRAYGRIVCRCENISEAEIVDAIVRPLGARSLDGVKRRTRAGKGRCQGGFCLSFRRGENSCLMQVP